MKFINRLMIRLAVMLFIAALIWSILPSLTLIIIDFFWYMVSAVILYYILQASQRLIVEVRGLLKSIFIWRA